MSVAPSNLAQSAANTSREQLLSYARAYQPGQQVYTKFATRNEQQENDLFVRTLQNAPGDNIVALRAGAAEGVKTGSAYMTLGSMGSAGLVLGAAWLGSHAAFAGHGIAGLACVGLALAVGLPLSIKGASVRSKQQHFAQQLDDWTVWLARNASKPAAAPAAAAQTAASSQQAPRFFFDGYMKAAAKTATAGR